MAPDSKGDDHQPKGTPDAGDGEDLHEDSFHGMQEDSRRPRRTASMETEGMRSLFSWNRAPSRRIEGGREALCVAP